MTKFTDAILFIEDFASVVAYVNEHRPECLMRDDEGNLTDPPVITGFARTPAVVNGNSLMVYARLREHEIKEWDGAPGVEVLAQAPSTGKGTVDAVYDALFADEEATAKYDSVYDRTERSETNEETGEVFTWTPPAWFGTLAC